MYRFIIEPGQECHLFQYYRSIQITPSLLKERLFQDTAWRIQSFAPLPSFFFKALPETVLSVVCQVFTNRNIPTLCFCLEPVCALSQLWTCLHMSCLQIDTTS